MRNVSDVLFEFVACWVRSKPYLIIDYKKTLRVVALLVSVLSVPSLLTPVLQSPVHHRWKARVVQSQWWEHSPLTYVAQVRSWRRRLCGLSLLLVLSFAARGFPAGNPHPPPPPPPPPPPYSLQKPKLLNSSSIWNSRPRLNVCLRTP